MYNVCGELCDNYITPACVTTEDRYFVFSEASDIPMLICDLRNLELHSDPEIPDRLRHSQHTIAWLVCNSLVDPPVLHQRIPGLRLVLLCRIRMYVWYLAARASLGNVQDNGVFTSLGRDLDSLPAIFVPGSVDIAFDENVRSKSADIDGEVLCGLEACVEFVDTALITD